MFWYGSYWETKYPIDQKRPITTNFSYITDKLSNEHKLKYTKQTILEIDLSMIKRSQR